MPLTKETTMTKTLTTRDQIAHIEEHYDAFRAHQGPEGSTSVPDYFAQYAHKEDLYTNLCTDLDILPRGTEAHRLVNRCVDSDLRQARENGSHIITGTKVGNVEITFHKLAKLYTVRNFNGGELLISAKPARNVREWLVNRFRVEVEA